MANLKKGVSCPLSDLVYVIKLGFLLFFDKNIFPLDFELNASRKENGQI